MLFVWRCNVTFSLIDSNIRTRLFHSLDEWIYSIMHFIYLPLDKTLKKVAGRLFELIPLTHTLVMKFIIT